MQVHIILLSKVLTNRKRLQNEDINMNCGYKAKNIQTMGKSVAHTTQDHYNQKLDNQTLRNYNCI